MLERERSKHFTMVCIAIDNVLPALLAAATVPAIRRSPLRRSPFLRSMPERMKLYRPTAWSGFRLSWHRRSAARLSRPDLRSIVIRRSYEKRRASGGVCAFEDAPRVRRSGPQSSAGRAFQRHGASHRAVDGAADRRGVSRTHRAEVSAPRSRGDRRDAEGSQP